MSRCALDQTGVTSSKQQRHLADWRGFSASHLQGVGGDGDPTNFHPAVSLRSSSPLLPLVLQMVHYKIMMVFLSRSSWWVQFQDITRPWGTSSFPAPAFPSWWRNSCPHLSLHPTSTLHKGLKLSTWKRLKHAVRDLWTVRHFSCFWKIKAEVGGPARADHSSLVPFYLAEGQTLISMVGINTASLLQVWRKPPQSHVVADLQASELKVSRAWFPCECETMFLKD